ncbi:NADH-quinone oxidoreductase subunit L [Conexibacter sp. DBS9H8]|uniref:NADH-quinone oxidoreductase subunit 5 family protein n=1 Tax=Conexibacter sp. DBS9H8 TaxID=2937801 RepID=UPI00200BFB34|nr:proton-conducting transporter membrane subunit [Conexibacter sp. DBS9H8]
MTVLLWLSVGLPGLGALVVRLTGRRSPSVAGAVAVASAVPPALLLAGAATGSRASSDFHWLPGEGLGVGLRLDPLSAAMAATVAGVGAVVLVYSIGYFARDERRASALSGLLAFLAVMQGLVLADGYLALLIFWELVGALSARLIAYTREDPAAPPGAVRAFLTTRSADVGFYLAVLALFTATGSLAFGQLRPGGGLGAIVGAGLVLAAIGKSAQAPLQNWLAGAMAGPTPVSALLHSSTMVAAGVYLLVRSRMLLAGWPLELVGWVGAVTAVAAAVIALAQRDLKRVLAGSTASQLGLMFVAAAAGAPAVAIFQLVTHAVGKAGLFLATGVFQHGRDSVALEQLRGAGRDDRPAFAGFVICALSIAAVPPLAAFWSKDHIVAAAQPRTAWFVLVLLAAAGSSAYLLRPALILWDRAGAGRSKTGAGRMWMLCGVAALSVASLGGGVLGGPLARLLGARSLPSTGESLALSLAALVGGGVIVLLAPRVPAAVRGAAEHQLYTPALQRLAVEVPVATTSRLLSAFELRGLDRGVDAAAAATLAAARASEWIERRGVDAAVDGLAAAVGRGGAASRRLQSGRLYEYLRDAVLGAVAVAVIVALAAL